MFVALFAASLLLMPPSSPPLDTAASRPIALSTATGDIFGSIVLPSGNGPHPVALIIAGSGPTDRNGNSPVPIAPGKTLHTDSYKLLAAALAAHGIASVRYDKRGVAASVAAMAGYMISSICTSAESFMGRSTHT